jgi:hypothetical protein
VKADLKKTMHSPVALIACGDEIFL